MYKIILPILLCLFLNCASSSAGIATSNIPVVSKKYKVIAPLEKKASWWAFDIAIIALPFQQPPLEQLLNEMIAEKEADALINIRYWQDRSIFFFMSRHRIGVTAEAIKFEAEEINVTPAKKTR